MSEKQSKSQTKSCKCHHGGQLDTVSLKLTDEFIRHFTHKQTECKQIVFVVVLNLFIMNKWCCPHNRSKAGNRNGSFAVNDINCHHDYTGCFFFFFYPWADSPHLLPWCYFPPHVLQHQIQLLYKDVQCPIPSVSSTQNGIVWDNDTDNFYNEDFWVAHKQQRENRYWLMSGVWYRCLCCPIWKHFDFEEHIAGEDGLIYN